MVFKERKQEFYNFTKEGEVVEGTLVSMKNAGFENNTSNYDIQTEKGTVTLGASSWLANLIKEKDIGKRIRITYLGEEAPKQRGYKPARMFRVEFDE